MPLSVGVPQGTVLEPLLFMLFINDLPTSVQHSDCNLFADDSMIHTEGTHDEIQRKLQTDVSGFHSWFEANKLTINVNKSGCMVIGTHQRLQSAPNLKLKMCNNMLLKTHSAYVLN